MFIFKDEFTSDDIDLVTGVVKLSLDGGEKK